MIRFNLAKLLDKLEQKEGKKITLKELSERSGCDRNVLSRIQSRPEIIPSANVIDKLVQFFFFEIARDPSKPQLDRNRMRAVIKDFVAVFPDDEGFWRDIPASFRENPKLAISELWQLYTKFNTPPKLHSPKLSEIKGSLKAKMLEADEARKMGSDIELILSEEEFDLLREQLPINMGGVKKDAN
jgi:transcriptional regulator with XRE-family HTH domain